MRIRPWQGFVLAGFLLVLLAASVQVSGSPGPTQPSADEARTQAIISSHFCPCQCGSYLPESDNSPACFGCSVGKAEVTFIRESIAKGRPVGEVLLALRETVLVEVFADYNDPRLPEAWALAQAAAGTYQQHRVVLRTPVADGDAMRAVEFAECGRNTGLFSAWQGSLIEHTGAWDFNSLLELATAEGLDGDAVRACLSRIDIAPQVGRDRAHARERELVRFPAVTVNRERVPIRDDALRKAIREIIRDAST